MSLYRFMYEEGAKVAHVRKYSHNSMLCGKLPLSEDDWRYGSNILPTCPTCHAELLRRGTRDEE